MSDRAVLLEPDDLFRIPDGDHYELIDGVPVWKNTGARADEIRGLLITHLLTFVRDRKLGRVFGAKTGYVCFPNSPKRVRRPGGSFVAKGRLPGDKAPEGYIEIAPDLAIEVVMPDDLYEDIAAKVADYRAAKVRLIWVVDPDTKTVLVRRLDGTCAELGETGELSGEDVIPGFTCKVAELFV